MLVSTRLPSTGRSRAPSSTWGLVSASKTTTGESDFASTMKHCASASWAERYGRKPYEFGSACTSATGTGMPHQPAINEMSEWLTAPPTPSSSQDERSISAFALDAPADDVSLVLGEAHRSAVEVLRRRTDAQVGWTVSSSAFEAEPGSEDVLRQVRWAWEDRFLEVSRDDDFVGIQSYTSQRVGPTGPVPHPAHPDNTLTGWPNRPDALETSIRHAWTITGGTPVLVTENGIATADDDVRITYTDRALHGLLEAPADGIDVRGYLHWSALDNYEWGDWGPTFGLIAVDRTSFVRTPRPSLGWLGALARTHAATDPATGRTP